MRPIQKLICALPADHPLRSTKRRVDQVLVKLSPLFDQLYADEGQPSIPPEQLLKSRILMALYAVRSERLFCEQLAYNPLRLWFLDRELDEGSLDLTVFTHNYQLVLSADAARLFFVEVYKLSRQEGWTSDQYFIAAGTLIEAWASLRSFVREDGKDQGKVGRGLSVEMSVKHDPVTLLSAVQTVDGKLKFLTAEGESVFGPILEIGSTNIRYRFSTGAQVRRELESSGPAHQCAVGVGHITGKLQKLAALLEIEAICVC